METKPQFILKKGNGESFANKQWSHAPAEEAAKPHLPESNKNNKSKQELYESKAKIFSGNQIL